LLVLVEFLSPKILENDVSATLVVIAKHKGKIIKILSSGAYDFSLAHTFCMSFKLALRLPKDFLNIQTRP